MPITLINKTQLDPNISDLVSGYGLKFFYPASNPSGFATGTSINSSSFLTTGQSGLFYLNTNPSGYITGVNLSGYATKSGLDALSGTYNNFVTNFNASNYATQSYVNQSLISFNPGTITTGQTGQFFSSYSGIYINNNLYQSGAQLSSSILGMSGVFNITGITLSGQTKSLYDSTQFLGSRLVSTGSALSGKIVSMSGTFNKTGINLSGLIYTVKQNLISTGYILSNTIYTTGAVLSGMVIRSGSALSGLIIHSGAALSGLIITSGAALSGFTVNSNTALSGLILSSNGSLNAIIANSNTLLSGMVIRSGAALSGLVITSGAALSGYINSRTPTGTKILPISLYNSSSLAQTGNNFIGGGFAPYISGNSAIVPIDCTAKSFAWNLYLPTGYTSGSSNDYGRNWSFNISGANIINNFNIFMGTGITGSGIPTQLPVGVSAATGSLNTPILFSAGQKVSAIWNIISGAPQTGTTNVVTLYCYY
jgi:hypothetical protein